MTRGTPMVMVKRKGRYPCIGDKGKFVVQPWIESINDSVASRLMLTYGGDKQ